GRNCGGYQGQGGRGWQPVPRAGGALARGPRTARWSWCGWQPVPRAGGALAPDTLAPPPGPRQGGQPVPRPGGALAGNVPAPNDFNGGCGGGCPAQEGRWPGVGCGPSLEVEPVQVVQRFLRHGTIKLTADLYTDLGPEDVRADRWRPRPLRPSKGGA